MIISLALAACVPVAHTSPPLDGSPDCGAEALQGLVGHPLPPGFTPPQAHRIYRSGDMLTLDYNPDRLNIELAPDTAEIVAIRCG
jgi:hypothetical protein